MQAIADQLNGASKCSQEPGYGGLGQIYDISRTLSIERALGSTGATIARLNPNSINPIPGLADRCRKALAPLYHTDSNHSVSYLEGQALGTQAVAAGLS